MGTVYLAEDTQIEREVALKTPHFTEDPTGEQMERFFREARAAGNLRHPNICPIYDFGQIDGRHFITMAYIEGRPLSAFIQPDNQQSERQILLLVRKLASALQEAHDHGVVHRDLKPANIMVDKKGEPIIMDFGLAQQTRRNEDVRLTQTGNILGTPAYMSPEQVEGEPDKIGPPADQYGLGVILYELLTGELPFRGSLSAVMAQILTREPSPPSQLRPDLDARIEAVCLKMMAKNPAERFRSLKAVADEISSILKSPAAKTTSKEKPASSPAPSPAGDRMRADVGASQVLKSLKQKTLTERDLESLEELARKCYSRHDFEQVIQIIERSSGKAPQCRLTGAVGEVPRQSRRNLVPNLRHRRGRASQRSPESPQEGRRAAENQTRAPPRLKVQEQFAGSGKGGAARLGPLQQFRQPWSEGGWIPWSVFASGLAVFAAVSGVIIVWLGSTAIVIDARDSGIKVEVSGHDALITVPGKQSIKVEPGGQEIKVSYDGLETVTRNLSVKRGESKILTVAIVDSKLIAQLENEVFKPRPDDAKIKARRKDGRGPGEHEPPHLANSGHQPPSRLAVAPTGKEAASKAITALTRAAVPLVAPFNQETAQKARQQWAASLEQPVEIANSIGMKLALIPPGEFLMGSTPDQVRPFLPGVPAQRRKKFGNDQYPQHRVGISRPFRIGTYEVTRGQFAAFVQATGYKTEGERDGQGGVGIDPKTGKIKRDKAFTWRNPGFPQGDSHPVVCVSWNDAVAFCEWLSQKEGKTYRLPTEAEWEYACRAGTTTVFSNGDDPRKLVEVANILDEAYTEMPPRPQPDLNDGYAGTAPVGSFHPNAFGLYDMHGNAWEWCQDRYDEGYYGHSPDTDPTGPPEGDRVTRGGAIDCPPRYCFSANRDRVKASERVGNLGFRVVLVAVPSIPPNSNAVESAASLEGFVPLFDGKSLAGWKTHPNQRGNWRVENGVLLGSGWAASHLYTQRGDFQDFDLRVEARINDGGNSGVDFRTTFGPGWPAERPKYPFGYEAQIDSTNHKAKTGSLFVMNGGPSSGTAVVNLPDPLVPPGQWFTMEVSARASHIAIKVDGREVVKHDDSHFKSGHIALQQLEPQTVVEFRKIEIQELAPAASSAANVRRKQDGIPTVSLDAGRAKTPKPKTTRSNKRYTDRQAAEFVLSLNGTVSVRQGKREHRIEPGKPLPAKSFRLVRVNFAKNRQVTDDSLEPIRGLTGLLELDVSRTEGITDAGLDSIRNLHSLEQLHLTETSIGDTGLASVEHLMRLKNLTLGKTLVTSAGLVHLRGLTRLENLWLHQTSVGDAGLEHLRGLTELRDLRLWDTRVTDAALVHLKPLQRLESLMLSGGEISDAGLAHLRSLSRLKKLWLTEANVTDAGVPDLVALSELRELNLRGTRITDTGLLQLQSLTALRKLTISGTSVTAQGVEKLRQALPACQIKS